MYLSNSFICLNISIWLFHMLKCTSFSFLTAPDLSDWQELSLRVGGAVVLPLGGAVVLLGGEVVLVGGEVVLLGGAVVLPLGGAAVLPLGGAAVLPLGGAAVLLGGAVVLPPLASVCRLGGLHSQNCLHYNETIIAQHQSKHQK